MHGPANIANQSSNVSQSIDLSSTWLVKAAETLDGIEQALPAIKDALERAAVFGEVVIIVDQGRIQTIEARPSIRTWNRGKRVGGDYDDFEPQPRRFNA